MNKLFVAAVIVLFILAGSAVVYQRNKNSIPFASNTDALEISNDTSGVVVYDTPAARANEMAAEIKQIPLSISSPANKTVVSVPKVTVSGKSAPGAEVFVNESEGKTDASGYFSLQVSLDEGENSIIVTVVNGNGDVAEKEIFVTFETAE